MKNRTIFYGLSVALIFALVGCKDNDDHDYSGCKNEEGEGDNDVSLESFAHSVCGYQLSCIGDGSPLDVDADAGLDDCVDFFVENVDVQCDDWTYVNVADCVDDCLPALGCEEHAALWDYWINDCSSSECAVSEENQQNCYFCHLNCDLMVDSKPNIYLYPPSTEDISVAIDFPNGGWVTVSDPPYGNGWSVTADPEGLIDETYWYLFYEAAVPDFYQYDAGWVLAPFELEEFFTLNLEAVGFRGREIDDFIEWWIPRLKECDAYQIYPQFSDVIENASRLAIDPKPASLLRYRYVITCDPSISELKAPPSPQPFAREGFTVTEWGVLVDHY